MRRFLCDVNVLIALIDSRHVRHNDAHAWLQAEGRQGWATCPLTELGVLRIVGSARYPNSPGTPAVVAASLLSLCASGGHEFWADDLRPMQDAFVDVQRLLNASQLTDNYLLALAAKHKGLLATFDRRLGTNAVRNGQAALHVIG